MRAWRRLGGIQRRKRRLDVALAEFRKTLRLEPLIFDFSQVPDPTNFNPAVRLYRHPDGSWQKRASGASTLSQESP